MEKMKFETVDGTVRNVDKIAEMFPQVVTEVLGEDGKLKRAVKWDVLKELLSGDYVEGGECYEFTWPGKRAAIAEAAKPIRKTLRPCKEESKNWDTTENLYIEGDNLEVLKLLQESYLGKVKMIYIDPPYNTGSDSFIYNDDFIVQEDELFDAQSFLDESGNINFKKNERSNPRFHSKWCSMMYERLTIAHNFLTPDGVIFISIDENELDNLTKICNEIFGPDNFINIVSVKTKIGGVSGSSEGKSLKSAAEYILIYANDKTSVNFQPTYIKTKLSQRIKDYADEGKSWKYTSVMTKLSGKEVIKEDKTRGMVFYGYRELETMSISTFAKEKGISEEEVYDQFADRIFQTTNAQSSVRQTVINSTTDTDYPMYGCEYIPIKGKNGGQKIEILYKGEQRRMMMFLADAVTRIDEEYYYLDKISTFWEDIQYNNLTKEGDIEFANGKKPIKMLQRMLDLVTDEKSIVMDFFSGSGSTAHAVMQQNFEKGGCRKFIMVQLQEDCTPDSDAYKAGFKTVCDLGKQRIRNAGEKIKEEAGLAAANLDIGFRVFKVADSNMKDVYYSAGDYSQDMLDSLVSNIKEDRTDLDLLYGCLLEWGVELSLPHTSETIDNVTVHTVNNGDLIACFDANIPESAIRTIAKRQPLRAVFRDSSFASAPQKINVEEIFKLLSPTTTVKVI